MYKKADKEERRVRREILRLWSLFVPIRLIAERYGKTQSQVRYIINAALASGEIVEERRVKHELFY